MKTKILTLILSITAMFAVAQTSEHLSFKGVPIDGTLNEFITEMERAGFNQIGMEDGISLLKGDFAGYKGCFIAVATLDQKDLVSKIGVLFPENETWSALSANYNYLKELLTEKYGEPSEIVEEFDTSYEPKDDNSRMYEVVMDRCKYYASFELENGSILLSIKNDGISKGFVILTYFDKINGEIIRQEALEDI